MKLLLLLSLSTFSIITYGNDSTSCKILMGLLNYKDAQRIFFFNEYKNLPIIIIDVKHKFVNCNYLTINEKKVQIIHDTSYLQQKAISYVIIHNLKRKNRKYKMEIYQKATGAAGNIEFEKKGNEYVVSKFDIGYF